MNSRMGFTFDVGRSRADSGLRESMAIRFCWNKRHTFFYLFINKAHHPPVWIEVSKKHKYKAQVFQIKVLRMVHTK